MQRFPWPSQNFLWSALLVTSCQNSSFKGKPQSEPLIKQAEPVIVQEPEAEPMAKVPAQADTLGSLTDSHTVSLKVDVVFAVDTSASMNEEIAATQANLGRLIANFNSGRLDSRIHLMLDTLFPLPVGSDPAKIAFVVQRVDSNDPIARLNDFFAGRYAALYQNAQGQPLAAPMPLRKEAKLEVVVITDDNGVGVGNLATDFDPNRTLKATFNSIIGLPTSVQAGTCELSAVGTEYMTLSTKSGGSVLDLCSADWSSLIGRLSTDIVKRSVTFPLSQKPVDPKAIVVQIDGQRLESADWSFDAQNRSLTLIKTDAVKDGSKLSIRYNPMAG